MVYVITETCIYDDQSERFLGVCDSLPAACRWIEEYGAEKINEHYPDPENDSNYIFCTDHFFITARLEKVYHV